MRWLREEIRTAVQPLFRPPLRFPVLSLLMATVLMLLCEQYGGVPFFRRQFTGLTEHADAFSRLLPHFAWFAASFGFYALAPMLWLTLWGKRLSDFGFCLGDLQSGLKWLSVLLPPMLLVVATALNLESFRERYPLNKAALAGIGPFLGYEIGFAAYFLAWEFFFRGFLLFSLKPIFGTAAVVIQTIPFALLHLGKPFPEALGAVPAGLVLGLLALRTRSILPGFCLHTLTAFAMDLGALLLRN